MRKHITLGLVLSSAMALSTFAFAAPADTPANQGSNAQTQQHHRMRGHHHGHHKHFRRGHDMELRKLNLSDEQHSSIKQIVKDSFSQNRTQWQALRQQRQAFESMTPDQVGYQAAADRLAQAEADATKLRVQQRANVRAQIYAVLTPQQKADMATQRSERQARMEKWKQARAERRAAAKAAPASK